MQRLTKQQVLLAGSYLMFSQLGGAEEAKTARPDQLDEIVVVGEKSERSQAVTGSSLSVYTEKDFKRRADWISTTALLKNSANILDTGLGNELPTVRGIDGAGPAVGAVAFFAGSRPRLNLSVDGRSAT